jgi:NTP pyrophosphatase (non-canonical NTP hydrolase)
MPGSPDPYCIGSYLWPGLSKFVEELGENGQVLGKIIAFPHTAVRKVPHPDGTILWERLHDEIGDLLAIIDYFADVNDLDWEHIQNRKAVKFKLFHGWHDEERNRVSARDVG